MELVMTLHAQKRLQQRGIPHFVVDLLDASTAPTVLRPGEANITEPVTGQVAAVTVGMVLAEATPDVSATPATMPTGISIAVAIFSILGIM